MLRLLLLLLLLLLALPLLRQYTRSLASPFFRYVAQVLCVAPECDMALLTVAAPAFWEGLRPVRFARALPRLEDAVTCVGYPIGGDGLSVTAGVVSRVEVTAYTHGSAELLGVQIDAAINAGNSGGPAFADDGSCVGIAFQSIGSGDAENIGCVCARLSSASWPLDSRGPSPGTSSRCRSWSIFCATSRRTAGT